jgi:cytochrome c2/glucose/arabinose dehydrogenase
VDAKPAFFLGDGSLHPSLPPGPFEVGWSGSLRIEEAGPFRFAAFVRGDVLVEVDGMTALEGRGESARALLASKAPLDREPGLYPLKIRYRSPQDLPARLQIWWEGAEFSLEPLPPWRLFHSTSDLKEAATEAELISRGRDLARRWGCAGCHRSALPGAREPPPGPSLADIGARANREWLLEWLADPSRLRAGARMPALFPSGRAGFVERWIVAEHLCAPSRTATEQTRAKAPAGDHRMGRRLFASVGCAACHFLPDVDRAEQQDLGRGPLAGLGDRFALGALSSFIINPSSRYPDGRMPRIPMKEEEARDIAAYLLLWSKERAALGQDGETPTREEMDAVARRLGAGGLERTAAALLREKRCAACHPGLQDSVADDVPLGKPGGLAGGCLSEPSDPRFALDPPARDALAAYLKVAARENHPSPFEERRRLLERSGCARCHSRDIEGPPPLEAAGSLLGGAWLQMLPFQRTPRLTYAHRQFTREHLVSAVQDGVSGLRGSSYSYRMPAFGASARELVQAMAEADGDIPLDPDEPGAPGAGDPTLTGLAGPDLVGFRGYSCIACHLWNGQMFSSPDPGAIGPELARVAGRVRREWFERFLESPARAHPGTPMPAFFPKGHSRGLESILGGDLAKQKTALWGYLGLGKDAPSPRPPPPLVVAAPQPGEPAIVAQIPVRLPGDAVIEGLCVLYSTHEILVYDLGAGALRGVYSGATLLRGIAGRLRTYTVLGTPVEVLPATEPAARTLRLENNDPPRLVFRGYDRLQDGVRVRSEAGRGSTAREVAETFRILDGQDRLLMREVRSGGTMASSTCLLPAPRPPPAVEQVSFTDAAKAEGSLERPGYGAVAFPRPKTPSGEDLLMPSALAIDPPSGRVFVASMRMGEVFVLEDPNGDGRAARFVDHARGLFQETYSMLAEDGALYILHRRSLTKAVDRDRDGLADQFDRVAALPQGVADDYDYAYGLVRDKTGAFVISHAPHANQLLPGSGGALRLPSEGDAPPRPLAFGFRNPLGWCVGPDREVFFTDNQGEWVATNKLCHLVEGRYYGYPNPAQKEHAAKPAGKAAVWIPYAWAKSVNGVTYDDTGGKFGPFAGQFFLAELMFGGAIIRASLEKVNGEYQGACFPFWGKGLLGPLVLAFDPGGRLYVGAITEPGWMSQPDRGALFRIDFTGETPFEMRTIRALPRGFRIELTSPASLESARDPASYSIEHYRYEHTGAYGSPELDRTDVPVERIEMHPDAVTVDLLTPPLVKERVYRISARGVRSLGGKPLVHPAGAYTLNQIPSDHR